MTYEIVDIKKDESSVPAGFNSVVEESDVAAITRFEGRDILISGFKKRYPMSAILWMWVQVPDKTHPTRSVREANRLATNAANAGFTVLSAVKQSSKRDIRSAELSGFKIDSELCNKYTCKGHVIMRFEHGDA